MMKTPEPYWMLVGVKRQDAGATLMLLGFNRSRLPIVAKSAAVGRAKDAGCDHGEAIQMVQPANKVRADIADWLVEKLNVPREHALNGIQVFAKFLHEKFPKDRRML